MNEQKSLKLTLQLVGVIVLAALCAVLCLPNDQRPTEFLQDLFKHNEINLGLDLKGGSELLYEVNPKDIDPTRTAEDVIDDTSNIISQRIDESGIVKDPRVQRQGNNRLLIQLPGLNKTDTNKIRKVIETLGNLEFRLVASENVGGELDENEERSKYDRAKQRGAKEVKRYQDSLKKKGYRWVEPKKKGDVARLLWYGKRGSDGYDISGKSFSGFRYDGLQQVISFSMREGAKRSFADLTKRYQKEFLAIVFNNRVVASPSINGPIPSGEGVLQGFSPTEYTALLKTLRSGSLEIQPELLHENTIGPSLGEDSIRLGINAGILGLAIVAGFIMFYYIAAGFIAVLALALNILIVFAILVIAGETLTLPGIAGLILTVGMSIDANIIIFERIREEKNKRWSGKDAKNEYTKQELLENLDQGYQQAFWTIFDANITTLITAGILYFIATGPVRNFAFVMGAGIVASFFTAIFVTHLLFNLLIEMRLVRKLGMLELVKKPNFGITNKMGIAGMGSIAVVLLSLVLFLYGTKGEKIYGLDLKGGVLAHISLEEPLTTKNVRNLLNESFPETPPEIQHIVSRYREGSEEKGWYEFSIRLPNKNEDKIGLINTELSEISVEMRRKHRALKEVEAIRVRREEERRKIVREIRKEKRKLSKAEKELKKLTSGTAAFVELETQVNDYKEGVKSLRETRDLYKDRLKTTEKEYNDKLTAINKVKTKRADLIKKKNELAGVEKLRKEIQSLFGKHLSPTSFGNMTAIEKGRFKTYRSLPINLQTPVRLEKISEIFKGVRGVDGAELAFGSYDVAFSDAKGSGEDIANLLKKHLQLARPSLEAKAFTVADGKTQLQFETAAPLVTVREAIEKCSAEGKEKGLFAEATVAVDGYSDDNIAMSDQYVTSFTLLLPPTDVNSDEVEGYLLSQTRNALENQEVTFNGEATSIFFSEPFPRFTQISGVVARAQKSSAAQAIVVSLLFILLYIAMRFPGWRFGFAAVLALAHDVIITLGAIALFNSLGLVDVKINLPIIAALLTIVGYSLNDTIVIFDRIRENQKKYEVWDRLGKEAVTTSFNQSINQTLSRTVLTSLTTLIVVGVIFALNRGKGSVMEGFSFALIVGVIVGTYSSIFVASAAVLRAENKNRTAS